jgi:hypothetical protein
MYTIIESSSARIWHNSEVDNNNNREEQEAEKGRRNFEKIERYLKKMHEIVVEQRALDNFQWINDVEKKFGTMIGIVDDIAHYDNRTTMPRTWRDHNQNTRHYRR